MTVTTEEAAELAGVSPTTIRSWVLRGDLEPVRRGARPLRFHYEDVSRVQRDKRGKTWVEQHAEARLRWGIALATEKCNDSGVGQLRPEAD